jgi:uncharacterized membrane protein YczE
MGLLKIRKVCGDPALILVGYGVSILVQPEQTTGSKDER